MGFNLIDEGFAPAPGKDAIVFVAATQEATLEQEGVLGDKPDEEVIENRIEEKTGGLSIPAEATEDIGPNCEEDLKKLVPQQSAVEEICKREMISDNRSSSKPDENMKQLLEQRTERTVCRSPPERSMTATGSAWRRGSSHSTTSSFTKTEEKIW